MDDKTYSMGGIGFLAILFILIFALVGRGGFGGWGNGFGGWGNGFGGWGGFPMWGNGFGFGGVGVPGYGLGFEDYKAICDSENQEIINSARTQYLVEQQGAETRAVATANANTTNTKIDYYAYQDLRDRLNESERKVMALENQLFVKEQLAPLTAQVADIRCNMLTKPVVNGLGTSCNPIITPAVYGFNGFNGCGYGCGYNNLA